MRLRSLPRISRTLRLRRAATARFERGRDGAVSGRVAGIQPQAPLSLAGVPTVWPEPYLD